MTVLADNDKIQVKAESGKNCICHLELKIAYTVYVKDFSYEIKIYYINLEDLHNSTPQYVPHDHYNFVKLRLGKRSNQSTKLNNGL